MIGRILRRKWEKAMKTIGKLENEYTKIITKVYDVYDFSRRPAGTEEPSCKVL